MVNGINSLEDQNANILSTEVTYEHSKNITNLNRSEGQTWSQSWGSTTASVMLLLEPVKDIKARECIKARVICRLDIAKEDYLTPNK